MTSDTIEVPGRRPMTRKATNLVIFQADALRRDYFPRSIKARGTYVDTIADGVHTPSNMPCILSGRPQAEHGCEFLRNDDVCQVPTVLDLNKLDHPTFDTSLWPAHKQKMVYRIFNFPPVKPLDQMEEPFVYVERCMAPHAPYGQCFEGCGFTAETDPRRYPDGSPYEYGQEYYLRVKRGEVDHVADYEMGVAMATARFFEVVRTLVEMGVYEDTFIVFTSDHGEAFPEDGYEDIMHRLDCPEVREIGTVFYDRDVEPARDPITSYDIIEHWWTELPFLLGDIAESDAFTTAHEMDDEEEAEMHEHLAHLGYL